MKAFIVHRYGSADGVRVGDMPDLEVREDDVLVQIHAAGVNLLDSKVRNGEFKGILPGGGKVVRITQVKPRRIR